MKDFLFKPEQAHASARTVGRRARTADAGARAAKPANLLVLDEPTNDLDMETLELQELVTGFAGTVLLVSTTKRFLDRTVTSVIAPDSNGRWVEYAGGYADMSAQRGGKKLEDRKGSDGSASPARPRDDRRSAQDGIEKAVFQAEVHWRTCRRRWKPFRRRFRGLIKLADRNTTIAIRPASLRPSLCSTRAAALSEMENEWLELEMLRRSWRDNLDLTGPMRIRYAQEFCHVSSDCSKANKPHTRRQAGRPGQRHEDQYFCVAEQGIARAVAEERVASGKSKSRSDRVVERAP
jgi:ATP-binding cassette subfamily F protein uup